MPRSWTEDELKRARDMRAAGYFCRQIDRMLKRRTSSTKRQLEGYNVGHNVRIADDLLAERDALAAARERLAPTKYFFGDPPAGYSALHGKTGLR